MLKKIKKFITIIFSDRKKFLILTFLVSMAIAVGVILCGNLITGLFFIVLAVREENEYLLLLQKEDFQKQLQDHYKYHHHTEEIDIENME